MQTQRVLIVSLLLLPIVPACFQAGLPTDSDAELAGTDGPAETGEESDEGEDDAVEGTEDGDSDDAADSPDAPGTDAGGESTGGDDDAPDDAPADTGDDGEPDPDPDDDGEPVDDGAETGDPIEPRRVFVTSESFSGDEVGLADQHCQLAANAAMLGGNWIAWISGPLGDAVDRLPDDAAPYVRLDEMLVAHDRADLVDGSLEAPINIDEDGFAEDVGTAVWTGSGVTGTEDVNTCLDWTVGTNAQNGMQGDAGRSDARWTRNFAYPCHTAARLYCMEL